LHVELRDGNALVERIILSLRQEEVWLQDYASFAEALVPVSSWILDYKRERPHQSLKYRKPVEVRQEAFGINAIRSLKCQPQEGFRRHPHDITPALPAQLWERAAPA